MGDPKREKVEDVARVAAEEAVRQLETLKELCARESEQSVGFQQLMKSLECSSRVELVQTIEDLVLKASVVEEVRESTGWLQDDIALPCSELIKKEAQLLEKEQNVISLQKQLEAAQRELKAQQQRMECSRRAEEDESPPGASVKSNYSRSLRTLNRLKNDWMNCKSEFQTGPRLLQESSALTPQGSPSCSGRTPSSSGKSSVVASEYEWSEDESCAGLRFRNRTGGSPVGMRQDMSSHLKYIALPEVRAYSGKEKDYSWESFKEAFELKYPRSSWSDKE